MSIPSPAGSSSTPSSNNVVPDNAVNGSGSATSRSNNRLKLPSPINIIVNNVASSVKVGEATGPQWRQRTLTSSSAASTPRQATFHAKVTTTGWIYPINLKY